MKKITTTDIAKLAGVSRTTVSFVLNNKNDKKISEETRNRILKIAKELNYRPNPFARGLKTNFSKTIALILPTITDPTMSVLIKGVENAAVSSQYSLMIHDIESSVSDRVDDIGLLCEKTVDGIIFAYPNDSDEEIINLLVNKLKIPTIIIGLKTDSYQANNVRLDYFGDGKLIADHLYDLGHRDIAVITGDININKRSRELRIEGIKNSLKFHGLEPKIIYAKDCGLRSSLFFDTRQYDMGYAGAINILEKGLDFTALIGTNELISIGAMNAFKSKDINIPGRISVASFGGYLMSEIVEPKLTVVAQATYKTGEIAFEMLKTILDGKDNGISDEIKEIVVKGKLVIRSSTGKASI